MRTPRKTGKSNQKNAKPHGKDTNTFKDYRIELVGYSDSDFGMNPTDRKSLSAIIIQLNGNTIHWRCNKQTIVATSVFEAEIIASQTAVKKITRNWKLHSRYGIETHQKIIIENGQSSKSQRHQTPVFPQERKTHLDQVPFRQRHNYQQTHECRTRLKPRQSRRFTVKTSEHQHVQKTQEAHPEHKKWPITSKNIKKWNNTPVYSSINLHCRMSVTCHVTSKNLLHYKYWSLHCN